MTQHFFCAILRMPRAFFAAVLCAGAVQAASPLTPLVYSPLQHGTFTPEGWLYRQLRIQADGLSGAFENFWEPVTNTEWTGGNSRTEDWVEIFPYIFAGYVPQAIILRDARQLATASAWIDAILARQTADGWLGPPDSERTDVGMRYWPQWPIVLSFLAWHDFGKSVNGTADPRMLAASLAWLHNASGMLTEKPMGRDWSGTRWQASDECALPTLRTRVVCTASVGYLCTPQPPPPPLETHAGLCAGHSSRHGLP